MTFFDPDTICPNCGIGKLIDNHENQERVCTRCGFVSMLPDYLSAVQDAQNVHAYKLGSDRKFAHSKKDYAGKKIDGGILSDLKIASKYDREQAEREEAAVSRIAALYDTVTHSTYDDGLKKADLEILKQRGRNMVEATGQRQAELDLMKIIRTFLKVKLAKYPELKRYFKLGLLHVKIRHKRQGPQNIAGRGNQIGKSRREGRIDYCNLCEVDIPNYKVKRHHAEYHSNILYHQYIDRKKQYVRRSARLEHVIVDCSATKGEKLENQEKGTCTHCDVSDAMIQRYPRIEIAKKERIDIVSRIVARHKNESTGRWKVCILQQRKIGQRKKD